MVGRGLASSVRHRGSPPERSETSVAVRLEWRERTRPLPAAAAWVPRAQVTRLLERLPAFRGLATASGLVLLAPEAELPWVHEVRYFGVDPAAPSLLLPTTRAPVVAVELVERAFRRTLVGSGPWLVDDTDRCVVPLERAGRIARPLAEAWLESLE